MQAVLWYHDSNLKMTKSDLNPRYISYALSVIMVIPHMISLSHAQSYDTGHRFIELVVN